MLSTPGRRSIICCQPSYPTGNIFVQFWAQWPPTVFRQERSNPALCLFLGISWGYYPFPGHALASAPHRPSFPLLPRYPIVEDTLQKAQGQCSGGYDGYGFGCCYRLPPNSFPRGQLCKTYGNVLLARPFARAHLPTQPTFLHPPVSS